MFRFKKKRSDNITSISSISIFFIMKSMVRVKRPIIMKFVLMFQLLMSLKLIIIGS